MAYAAAVTGTLNDLNAGAGKSDEHWNLRRVAELMKYVTSVSGARESHAGDAATMLEAVHLAETNNRPSHQRRGTT